MRPRPKNRLINKPVARLRALMSACVGTWAPRPPGRWLTPHIIPISRPGKSGIAAARREARKARNRWRARHVS